MRRFSGGEADRPPIDRSNQAKGVIVVLAISDGAVQVIKQVVSSAQMPGEGGIRISAQPVGDESVRLELSLATSPEPGDAIVEQEGANGRLMTPWSKPTKSPSPSWSTGKTGRTMDNLRTSIRATSARSLVGRSL